MGKVQLIIDNQIADVYSQNDLVTAITYSISDINDIEKRGNATSKTIKIPATARNKKIFKHADDISVTSFKGQKSEMIGIIRESGTDVLVGLTNLKTFQQNGVDSYFEITIVGNCGEWLEYMSNNNLRAFSTNGFHYKTSSYISASLAGTYEYAYALINNGWIGGQVMINSIEDDGNGRCKCIIDGTNQQYGLRKNIIAATWVNGLKFDNVSYNKKHYVISEAYDHIILQTMYMGDSSGIIRNTSEDVLVEHRSLVINVEKIITQMFKNAGYKVSSTFLSSAFFKKLFILPGKETQVAGFDEFYKVGTGLTANYSVGSIYNAMVDVPLNEVKSGNSGVFNTTTHKFTAPCAMFLNIKASLYVMGTDQYPAYIRFVVNNSPGLAADLTNKVRSPIELSETEWKSMEQEAELRLQSGDTVSVQVIVTAMDGVPGSITINKDNTLVEFLPTNKIIKGSPVFPYELLPEIKQLDFLKAIRHLFNLYFFTDVNMKTVYIEPRDTFYKRDKFIDLSAKLDLSESVMYEELGADVPKTLTFRYKEDSSDWGIAQLDIATGTKYSSRSETVLNKFSPREEKVIENNLFAPVLMDHFPGIGITGSYLPKIWGEPQDGDTYPEVLEEFTPRILYFAGVRDCKAGESWKFEGATQSTIPLFCSNDIDTVNDASLLFDSSGTSPDLFFKHYANYLKTLNEGRKITAYMKINSHDVQALVVPDNSGTIIKDFRSLVYFRNKGTVIPCRLESINDYSAGMNRSTKVILVTDVDNISQQVSPLIPSMSFTNNASTWGGNVHSHVSIYKFSSTWSDCRNSNNGSGVTQTTGGVAGSTGSLGTFQCRRLFLAFDTSLLPNAATIVEAYLDIYKLDGDISQELMVFEGTQGIPAGFLSTSDYNNFGTVPFGESSPGGAGLRRISLNASGIAIINKTGWTQFCLREKYYDVGNIQPPANFLNPFNSYLIGAPEAYLNKLTVKYTV